MAGWPAVPLPKAGYSGRDAWRPYGGGKGGGRSRLKPGRHWLVEEIRRIMPFIDSQLLLISSDLADAQCSRLQVVRCSTPVVVRCSKEAAEVVLCPPSSTFQDPFLLCLAQTAWHWHVQLLDKKCHIIHLKKQPHLAPCQALHNQLPKTASEERWSWSPRPPAPSSSARQLVSAPASDQDGHQPDDDDDDDGKIVIVIPLWYFAQMIL